MRSLPGSLLVAACLLAGAAHAEIIGTVDSDKGRIDLHDDKGSCVAEARRAEFTPPEKGEHVAGCWVAGGPFILVVFFDADIARIPVAAIQPPKSV